MTPALPRLLTPAGAVLIEWQRAAPHRWFGLEGGGRGYIVNLAEDVDGQICRVERNFAEGDLESLRKGLERLAAMVAWVKEQPFRVIGVSRDGIPQVVPAPGVQFLTPAEAAAILKVTRRTVYSWIRAGKIKATKFGGVWRIRQSDVGVESGREKP